MTAVLVIASMAGIICWRVGWRPWLPADLFFIGVAGVIALGDLFTKRIPNRVVISVLAIETALAALACLWSSSWIGLSRGALAGVLLAGFYACFSLLGGVGGGDVKFAAVAGEALGWIGWSSFVVGAFGGMVLFVATGWVLRAIRRADRRTPIPFAPALYLGAAIVLCWTPR
jgi:leader peptidase (prepilin peptidase)/N-methyltransferase